MLASEFPSCPTTPSNARSPYAEAKKKGKKQRLKKEKGTAKRRVLMQPLKIRHRYGVVKATCLVKLHLRSGQSVISVSDLPPSSF